MSNASRLSEAFRSRPDALTADDLSVHAGGGSGDADASLEPRVAQDSDVREIAQPASDRSSWMAGSLLGGKYTMLRPLGVGGMGVVWLARNEGTGANVAIKLVLPRSREDEAEILARFRREAYATAKMRHRSIVCIYDLVELPSDAAVGERVDGDGPRTGPGPIALVMELLEGETLAKLLERRGKIAVHEAVDIALALLSALAHAHDAGIVHRDLKPENVFLSFDSEGAVTPKILDFGISKLAMPKTPAITRAGEMLGTPSYMSPEQARGTDVDGRSDLFNVGILLYEMLTGENPFAGEALHSVIVAILEADPAPLPDTIPPEVAEVVMRALAKKSDERFSSARDMAASLRCAVGDPAASSVPRLNVATLSARTSLPMELRPTAIPPEVTPDSVASRGADDGDDDARHDDYEPELLPSFAAVLFAWRRVVAISAAALVVCIGLGVVTYRANEMALAMRNGPVLMVTKAPTPVQTLETVDPKPVRPSTPSIAVAAEEDTGAVEAVNTPPAATIPTSPATSAPAATNAKHTRSHSGTAGSATPKRHHNFFHEPGF